MTTFYHTLCLLKHNACNLHMTLCWLVECRGDNLCIYCARHVCNFLRTLVDEKHHEICFRMVCCNGVGNVLHQDCLTGLWLCDNECTLTFADRREYVYDACAQVCCSLIAAEIELLVREERSEVLECNAVAHIHRLSAIYKVDACKREILLAVVRRAYMTFNDITGLESVALYLLCRNVHIIRR